MVSKKRPIVVSILAGWLIICSVVGAVVSGAVIPRVEVIRTDSEQARWIVDHLGRSGLLAIALVTYAFGGSVGAALWRLRPWGRRAVLLISAGLVAFGVAVIVSVAIRAHAFDVDALVNTIVFGWPLYYFNLTKIKVIFAEPPDLTRQY